MGDVLTNEEVEAIDLARRLTCGNSGRRIFAHEAALVAIIDRLVSEVENVSKARDGVLQMLAESTEQRRLLSIDVERLRARNEALEGLLRRALHPNDGMSKEWYDDAIAALSDLEEPSDG